MGNFSFSISLLTAMKNLTLPKNKKSDVDPVVHALTAHRQIAACDNDGTCFPFAYVAFYVSTSNLFSTIFKRSIRSFHSTRTFSHDGKAASWPGVPIRILGSSLGARVI
jgi:Leucine-rich repeat (LRR) protein